MECDVTGIRGVGEPRGGYGFSITDPEGRVLRVIAGGESWPAASDPDQPIKVTHAVLYTAEIEPVTDASPVRAPKYWAYPPGRSDLWGATPPPSAPMKAAQMRIGFAPGLFRP